MSMILDNVFVAEIAMVFINADKQPNIVEMCETLPCGAADCEVCPFNTPGSFREFKQRYYEESIK